jgi:hypothetical protein
MELLQNNKMKASMRQPSRGLIKEESKISRGDRDVYTLQASQREYKQTLINRIFFPNLPDHYPLSKKLYIAKHNTTAGARYIFMLDVFSVLLCLDFLVQGQTHSYHAVQTMFLIETVLVAFIFIDTFISCYISRHYINTMNIVLDVATIFPTVFVLSYVFGGGHKLTYFAYEYLSLVKLVRILRLFRTLHLFKHRVQRIIIKFFLTFASLCFVAAGFLHLFENVLPQRRLECEFINEDTNWQPSCSDVTPASEMTYCDCAENNCEFLYDVSIACTSVSLVLAGLLVFRND